MRVDLGNGQWAELREISDLRRADRRVLNKAITYEVDPESARPVIRASLDDDMADAVLPIVVSNWSLPLPLPSRDIKSLDLLTLEQDTALREGIQGHIDALQGKNAPAKENADPTTGSAS
jgi:hypothetical protein